MEGVQVSKATDVAIFSRNHPQYLAEAARKGADERTTFRSNARWVSAQSAIARNGTRRIYFAAIDGTGDVEYEADLVQVLLDPSLGQPTTRALLEDALESTRDELLWGDSVKTLYVIANCRRLSERFPQTHLRKISDGTPLDRNFVRSYALVHERKQ